MSIGKTEVLDVLLLAVESLVSMILCILSPSDNKSASNRDHAVQNALIGVAMFSSSLFFSEFHLGIQHCGCALPC